MNRRKKIIRYKRLFESQWKRLYAHTESNDNAVHTARMLIAARKRVAPWCVVAIRGCKDNRVTAFEIV